MSSFAPLTYLDGYLPTEDFGLIGDLSTAALVGRDGSIPWLCLPRFDAPPVFSGILDKENGGAFTVTPVGLQASRQYYLEDSGVLVTEMRAAGGTVRVTDALTLRAGADLAEGTPAERSELLRCIKVLAGTVTLNVSCAPKGGAEGQTRSGGLHLELRERPELHLLASRPLGGLTTVYELNEGEELHLRLTWGHPAHRYQPIHPDEVIQNTVDSWRRWLECFNYGGPRHELVRRSAITLKLLSYSRSGAVVAAPTSSLPETIGGERNWDYRYTWVRDAAFSVYALRQVGITQEAWSFLGWVLDALERGARLAERYGLSGDAKGWRKEAEVIRETILEKAWDDELGSLTEHIGPDGGLDASLLALPLRRVIDANHPKMKVTTEAVVKHLSAKGAESDGLLYRYLPERSPDGLGSEEGTFVLCSFWLVDILADQGRIDEAEALFHSLCDRVNHLGLFAEEIDPDSGKFLGNFPQAFSHIGVITSATNLIKRKGERHA